MDKQERARVIDKIKKLLALAQSPNENEALAAAEKAQALLAEHNLSADELSDTDDAGFMVGDGVTTNSRPWRRQVANAVAAMYFCKYLFVVQRQRKANGRIKRSDEHMFIGAEHNIAVAKLMFNYLTATIERLAKEDARGHAKKGSFKRSFHMMCGLRVAQRIQQRIAKLRAGETGTKTSDGRNLPALASLYDQTAKQLDDFLKQKFGKLKERKQRMRPGNVAGAMAGLAAGDRVGLDIQLTGENTTHLLGR